MTMQKPRVLPLPGNSSREGSFYEEQRPAGPAVTGPTGAALDDEQPITPYPASPGPLPFKIDGGR